MLLCLLMRCWQCWQCWWPWILLETDCGCGEVRGQWRHGAAMGTSLTRASSLFWRCQHHHQAEWWATTGAPSSLASCSAMYIIQDPASGIATSEKALSKKILRVVGTPLACVMSNTVHYCSVLAQVEGRRWAVPCYAALLLQTLRWCPCARPLLGTCARKNCCRHLNILNILNTLSASALAI